MKYKHIAQIIQSYEKHCLNELIIINWLRKQEIKFDFEYCYDVEATDEFRITDKYYFENEEDLNLFKLTWL